MEKKKMNKKPLIALLLVAVVGVVGGTFAYFSSSVTIPNIFQGSTFKTEVREDFKSPENWVPGVTANKTVTVKNDGSVDVAVRVKLDEAWTSGNGDALALEVDGKRAALVNLADDAATKWTKDGDWYYYNTKLTKGQTTTSLLKSVQFNPEIEVVAADEANGDIKCTTVEDATGLTHTCQSTGDGYAGARYVLNVTAQTIQFDAYKTEWNTTVEIN